LYALYIKSITYDSSCEVQIFLYVIFRSAQFYFRATCLPSREPTYESEISEGPIYGSVTIDWHARRIIISS